MKTEVRLRRDLRKSILRGNPWVYASSLEQLPKENGLVKLLDKKGFFLGWGYSDLDSPIAVRVITTQKKPPNEEYYKCRFECALKFRRSLFGQGTNAFRLFNGEGDGLPGMVCDVYSNTAVLQFDGSGALDFWDQELVADWLLSLDFIDSVVLKARHDQDFNELAWGKGRSSSPIEVSENSIKFYVDVVDGQKTGFFLDQRDNREYVRHLSKNKSVLNLFSYTGGFSLYAAIGGARKVASVDIAGSALDLAKDNFRLNRIDFGQHQFLTENVYDYVKKGQKSQNMKWDIVICDPPSMAPSEAKKPGAIKKYIEVFSDSAKLLRTGGDLILSSCSSHIKFTDFEEIVREALSKARKVGRVRRVSGQGADHPFPLACPELRYLKFYHLELEES